MTVLSPLQALEAVDTVQWRSSTAAAAKNSDRVAGFFVGVWSPYLLLCGVCAEEEVDLGLVCVGDQPDSGAGIAHGQTEHNLLGHADDHFIHVIHAARKIQDKHDIHLSAAT